MNFGNGVEVFEFSSLLVWYMGGRLWFGGCCLFYVKVLLEWGFWMLVGISCWLVCGLFF